MGVALGVDVKSAVGVSVGVASGTGVGVAVADGVSTGKGTSRLARFESSLSKPSLNTALTT